jgi:hypothetical protein
VCKARYIWERRCGLGNGQQEKLRPAMFVSTGRKAEGGRRVRAGVAEGSRPKHGCGGGGSSQLEKMMGREAGGCLHQDAKQRRVAGSTNDRQKHTELA